MIGASMYLSGREVSTGEYISHSNSCSMCKRMIINAGIEKVVVRDSKDEYRITDVFASWVKIDASMEQIGY